MTNETKEIIVEEVVEMDQNCDVEVVKTGVISKVGNLIKKNGKKIAKAAVVAGIGVLGYKLGKRAGFNSCCCCDCDEAEGYTEVDSIEVESVEAV